MQQIEKIRLYCVLCSKSHRSGWDLHLLLVLKSSMAQMVFCLNSKGKKYLLNPKYNFQSESIIAFIVSNGNGSVDRKKYFDKISGKRKSTETIWPPPSPTYLSVWPDLAKFRHFGNILKVFGICLWVNFELGTLLKLIWQFGCNVEKIQSHKWPKIEHII